MDNKDLLNEINNLINIKNYISTTIYTKWSLDKSHVNSLNRLQEDIEKKIYNKITSDNFKSYINDDND